MFDLVLAATVFALAYLNGANDLSKGIATLAGSGAMRTRSAIWWGTLTTVCGAMAGIAITGGLLKTFSSGMLHQTTQSAAFPIAVASGAILWILFATQTGMPVSTTHALTGGIVGAALAQFGGSGILWQALLQKIAIPLLASPVVAFALAWLAFPVIRRALSGVNGYCLCVELQQAQAVQIGPAPSAALALGIEGTRPELNVISDRIENCEQLVPLSSVKLRAADSLHLLTSGLTSFARGMNDTPKIAALLIGASVFQSAHTASLFGFVALGMCAGSLLGGRRVLETLSTKITPMDGIEGFTANMGAATLVTAATLFGMPLSTTHVTTSAIVGIGARARRRANWKIVREIAAAWLVTLPVAAAAAYLTNAILLRLGF